MSANFRGIECSLYNDKISNFLMDISQIPYDFFIPWCTRINNSQRLLPTPIENVHACGQDIKRLAMDSIWELVLHLYPVGEIPRKINTYEDFLNSTCICCLIFYDCGLMDIYIKDQCLLKTLWKKLDSLQAQDMRLITDTNDSRTVLHL